MSCLVPGTGLGANGSEVAFSTLLASTEDPSDIASLLPRLFLEEESTSSLSLEITFLSSTVAFCLNLLAFSCQKYSKVCGSLGSLLI